MRLLSRRVIIQKSPDEVQQILKSSAYYFPEAKFSENRFSIYCAKRFNGGTLSLIPVEGTITQNGRQVEVILAIRMNLIFFLGCLISSAGVIGFLICMISHSSRCVAEIGQILFGLFIIGLSLWEGAACLDRLEHKLLL